MWPQMRRMGIRELRDTLTQAIRLVRAGETIEITHDGEPVALITPVRKSRLEELIAAGEATAPKRPFAPPRRRLRVAGSRTASEVLQELRAERF
jgi:prevent-host-death family protein